MLEDIFLPFLLFSMGLSLAFLAQYTRNPSYLIASGVWFIGLAVGVFMGEVALAILGGLFFLVLGLGLIFHGAAAYYYGQRNQEEWE